MYNGTIVDKTEMVVAPTQAVPLVCGGIYRYYNKRAQRVYTGICHAVMERENPRGAPERIGEFKFFGLAEEQIKEGSDRMNKLILVGRPASPKVGRPRKR